MHACTCTHTCMRAHVCVCVYFLMEAFKAVTNVYLDLMGQNLINNVDTV